MIANTNLLRYNTHMVVYVQVKKSQGTPPEIKIQQIPPAGWDDSEDRELELLARGAGELARKSLQKIDKDKAEECRKKLLQEMLTCE